MMIKYRVHEVAKDFDVPSKDIVTLLSKYFDEAKKSQTALEEHELDIIFDYMTQNNQVESFDSYFAAGEKAREERRAAEAKKKQEKLAEQARIAEEFAAMARAAKAEKEGKAAPAANTAKTDKSKPKSAENKSEAAAKKPASAAPVGEKQPTAITKSTSQSPAIRA